jgi:hypothetical protein
LPDPKRFPDVIEGRIMDSGMVARLQTVSAFRAAFEAAKAKLASVHAKALKPTRDCLAEAETLLEITHGAKQNHINELFSPVIS